MSTVSKKLEQKRPYPEALFSDVFQDNSFEIPEGFEEAIQYCLLTLNPREANVLTLFYKNGLTLREIGEIYDAYSYTIGKIKNNALKKLRESECCDILKYGEKRFQEMQEEEKKTRLSSAISSSLVDINTLLLSDLGLSAKVINTLNFFGIKSVADFMEKKPKEFIRMRGIGTKYIQEIITKLKILNIDYIQYHMPDFDSQTAKFFGIY